MPEVFVGIGSNVRPEAHVQLALNELESRFAPIIVSPIYRNPAVGFDGADFLNLVVGFITVMKVPALMEVLHELERRCGRQRSEERWGPRTLDLDLLIYGEDVRDAPPIPRADVLKRAFVLRPLADIAPENRHPVNGKTFAELWACFPGESGSLSEVRLPEPRSEALSKTGGDDRSKPIGEIIDEKLS